MEVHEPYIVIWPDRNGETGSMLNWISEEFSDFDVNCQDEDGRSPLHLACFFGLEGMVRYLLWDLVDTFFFSDSNKNCDLNCEDYEGLLPIHLLIQNNFLHIIKLLLHPPYPLHMEVRYRF